MKNKSNPLGVTLELIGGVSLALIMLYTVANIVIRSTVGTPLPAVVELITRWWMVPLVFVGIIVAQPRGEHVRVDFVGDNLGLRWDRLYRVVSRLFLILFTAFVVIGGWEEAVRNMQRGEFGIDSRWPIWLTRFAVPVLGTAFVIYLIVEISRAIRTRGDQHLGEDVPLEEGLV